jgi:hypothetical protein
MKQLVQSLEGVSGLHRDIRIQVRMIKLKLEHTESIIRGSPVKEAVEGLASIVAPFLAKR